MPTPQRKRHPQTLYTCPGTESRQTTERCSKASGTRRVQPLFTASDGRIIQTEVGKDRQHVQKVMMCDECLSPTLLRGLSDAKGIMAVFFAPYSRRTTPVGPGRAPKQSAVTLFTCFPNSAAYLWQSTSASPLSHAFIKIGEQVIAEPDPEINKPGLGLYFSFFLIAFLIIYAPINPQDHLRAPPSCRVGADRPRTTFWIPYFHAEFPIVHTAASRKKKQPPGEYLETPCGL